MSVADVHRGGGEVEGYLCSEHGLRGLGSKVIRIQDGGPKELEVHRTSSAKRCRCGLFKDHLFLFSNGQKNPERSWSVKNDCI